jgi:ubiquitin carboxyl-terminal hydrolase 34
MKRCSPFLKPCKSDEARERRIAESPLPLTQTEENYFKWTPPRIPSALVVYTKLLELTGTQSAMEKMTADMLRAPTAPAEHEFIEEVKNTLLNSISVDPAVHATPYLQCLLAFVAATKSQTYIAEIIAKVAEEIPTIGLTGGMEHLRFFQSLWPLDGPDRSIKSPIIESISCWAPALIVYHDSHVRDAVEDFLDQVIFEEPSSESDIIRRAVMDLANGLFQFIVNKFPHNRQPLDETTFSAAWRILTRCKDSQLDETQYNDRLEGMEYYIFRIIYQVLMETAELKTFIDHLGLGLDEEDVDDVASG